MKLRSIVEYFEKNSSEFSPFRTPFQIELFIIYILAFLAGIRTANNKLYVMLFFLLVMIVLFPFYTSFRIYIAAPNSILTVEKLGMALFISGALGLIYGAPVIIRMEFELIASGFFDELRLLLVQENIPDPTMVLTIGMFFILIPALGFISLMSMASGWIGFISAAWLKNLRIFVKDLLSPLLKQ